MCNKFIEEDQLVIIKQIPEQLELPFPEITTEETED